MALTNLLSDNFLAGPAGNTYAVLKSLDLVCDEDQEKQLWCKAVCNGYCYDLLALTVLQAMYFIIHV